MKNLNLSKTGILTVNTNKVRYLVNNFSVTGNTTGWTLDSSSTLSDGTVILSAVNPTILSPYFDVGLNDIICVEFTVALPTPSTQSGAGRGIFLGTPGNQGVFVHTFNHDTKKWLKSTTANNNPYFLHAYNLSEPLTLRNYVLGADVDLDTIPFGETTNTAYPARAIQLTSSLTNTRLRTGYNANTSMVIEFSNPRFYNISQIGFHDDNSAEVVKFGKGWADAYSIIEY